MTGHNGKRSRKGNQNKPASKPVSGVNRLLPLLGGDVDPEVLKRFLTPQGGAPHDFAFTPPDVVDRILTSELKRCLPLVVRRSSYGFDVGVRKFGYEGSEPKYIDLPDVLPLKARIQQLIAAVVSCKSSTDPIPRATPDYGQLNERLPDAERILSRTLRMLLLLESLLLAESPKSELVEEAAHLKASVPQLKVAIGLVMSARLPLPKAVTQRQAGGAGATIASGSGSDAETPSSAEVDPDWTLWMPLILVTAVAYSQCEYTRSYCWEAYSAGRARADLAAQLPADLERVFDLVALFIRHQSSMGQLARKTGGRHFLLDVERIARRWSIDRKVIDAALLIMSVVEEARSHLLPGFGPTEKLGEVQVNHHVASRWGREEMVREVSRVAANINAPAKIRSGEMPTWSWSRKMGLSDKRMRAFRLLVQSHPRLQSQQDIHWFTFDRTQVEDLNDEIRLRIEHVMDAKDCLAAFDQTFQLHFTSFPNALKPTAPSQAAPPERACVVLLDDRLAAEKLLFRRTFAGRRLKDQSAGALFRALFERAVELFGLRRLVLRKNQEDPNRRQEQFVPFPLVARLLRTVYRLRPQSCAAVPIVFDDATRETVRIPMGLDEKKDRLLIDSIAAYTLGVMLNRAVSRGFRKCDIGIAGLLAHDLPGSARPGAMSGKKWKAKLDAVVRENGCDILGDKYLRDYNTERKSFQFVERPDAEQLLPVGTSEIGPALRRRLAHDSRESCLVLGVDIGGTFTKYGLYECRPGAEQMLVPVGEAFRMLTADPASQAKGAEKKSPAEMARRLARRMIESIEGAARRDDVFAECLKRHRGVLSAGLSWPGPVRNDHITGTSSSIQLFGLSHRIMENRIEEILSIDLCGAFREAWTNSRYLRRLSGQTEHASPLHAAMLNDGTADGIGRLISTPSLNASPPQCLIVIKLGTGTAGAVFSRLRLDSGPSEWGKLILDVGAPFSRDFPAGRANQFLSRGTMPDVARMIDTEIFGEVVLDSLELGLLLEVQEKGYSSKSLDDLRNASGILHLAGRFAPQIDAEMLRRAVRGGDKAEPELFDVLAPYLQAIGAKAHEKLIEMVDRDGILRLCRVLRAGKADDIRVVFDSVTPDEKEARKLLEPACQVAEKCAERLGAYLGDMIALLFDQYRMETILLAGGVLSGQTGVKARACAVRRLELYGLAGEVDGPFLRLTSNETRSAAATTDAETDAAAANRTSPAGRSPNDDREDKGTLGAAAYGIAEYLFQLKRRGITAIEARLMRMAPDESVAITSRQAEFPDDDSIMLDQFALTAEEVNAYLQASGHRLGFLKAPSSTEDRAVYTRWLITAGD